MMLWTRWRCYLWGTGPHTAATGVARSHGPIGLGPCPISFFCPYFSLCESFVFLCCQLACGARDVAGAVLPPLDLRGVLPSFFFFLFDGMMLPSSAPLGQRAQATFLSFSQTFFLSFYNARPRAFGAAVMRSFFFLGMWSFLSFLSGPRQERVKKDVIAHNAHAHMHIHPVTTVARTTGTSRDRRGGRQR
nr:hypothetical protein [Pandoravirus belohorizontensis]